MCRQSRGSDAPGSWTLFFPVAFAGSVYVARLLGERVVPARGVGLLFLGLVTGGVLFLGLLRRRVLHVDARTGAVAVRLAGRWGPGAVEHEAPAWAIAVERRLDPAHRWRVAPALRFPDGARVIVGRSEADRVRRLRLETSARPYPGAPGAPIVFVAGREAALLGRASRGALLALALGFVVVGLRVSIGGHESEAARDVADLALTLMAFAAAVTGLARHFRTEVRIVDRRAVEVRTTVLGLPLDRVRRLPFLAAVRDPRQRRLEVGRWLQLRFPQFPHGDPLSAAGAEALDEAALALRARLAPVLALARDDAGAAHYREPADMSMAATRAAVAAPDAVLELQKAPRAIVRRVCAQVSGAEETLVRVLRSGRL